MEEIIVAQAQRNLKAAVQGLRDYLVGPEVPPEVIVNMNNPRLIQSMRKPPPAKFYTDPTRKEVDVDGTDAEVATWMAKMQQNHDKAHRQHRLAVASWTDESKHQQQHPGPPPTLTPAHAEHNERKLSEHTTAIEAGTRRTPTPPHACARACTRRRPLYTRHDVT